MSFLERRGNGKCAASSLSPKKLTSESLRMNHRHLIKENHRISMHRNLRKLKENKPIPPPKYIQGQINIIRNSQEAGQLQWQTVNGVSRGKSTSKAKLNAARLQKWNEHFSLLGKRSEVIDKPKTNINSTLDIKFGRKNLMQLQIRYGPDYGRPDKNK